MKNLLVLFSVFVSTNALALDFCTVYTDKIVHAAHTSYNVSALCSGGDSVTKKAEDWKEARTARIEIIKGLLEKGYEVKAENNLARP